MVDLGAHAAMKGFNVAHYTLELTEIETGQRYDSRVSGINIDDLTSNKEVVRGKVKDTKGNLIIKAFPAGKTTIQSLKVHYSTLLTRGIRPDVILIDYADLLNSVQDLREETSIQESVYRELKGWAQEIKTPIWTVTQINRTGFDADVITLKHLAGYFNRSHITDLFITMNRKKDSPTPDIGNIFIAKNRLGEDGIKLPMLINTAISKIEILSPESEGDLSNNENGSYMDKLKQKYKDFQKKKESTGSLQ